MSVEALSWAWKHSRSEGLDLLVLLAIADYANEDGRAWPSMGTLSAKCRVSRRTVARSITTLAEMGELERVTAGGVKGRGGTTNCYRMTFTTDPKWCQGVTSDSQALVPHSPEVVSHSHLSGVQLAHEPSVTVSTPNRTRRTSAPDLFPITDEMREYAASKGMKWGIEALTEDFLLHHRAKGSKFSNWYAAWQKWVRNAEKWSPGYWKPEPGRVSVEFVDDFAGEVYR